MPKSRRASDRARSVRVAPMVALVAAVVTMTTSSAAFAEDEMMGGEHKAHTANLVGAKLFGFLPASVEGKEWSPGVSAFYEREVIQHLLEIELNTGVVFEEHEKIWATDLVFKVPLHGDSHATPYIGAGLVYALLLPDEEGEEGEGEPVGEGLEVEGEEEGNESAFGVIGVAGAYIWFNKTVGLDIELNLAYLREHEEWVTELVAAVGPVFHF